MRRKKISKVDPYAFNDSNRLPNSCRVKPRWPIPNRNKKAFVGNRKTRSKFPMDEKRGPGSRPWATFNQRQYLISQRLPFLAAKAKNATPEFWASILTHWELAWGIPDIPISPEERIENPDQTPKELLIKVSVHRSQ
jgi:hypothetical protein